MGKVKLKMGMHNRITKERFCEIKKDLDEGMGVAKAANKHEVCDSTIRKIRRSANFNEYRIRADAQVKSRKPLTVMCEKAGVPYEDFGAHHIFSSKTLTNTPSLSDRLDREAERTARGLGIIVLAVIAIAILGLMALAAICVVGGAK